MEMVKCFFFNEVILIRLLSNYFLFPAMPSLLFKSGNNLDNNNCV